MVGLLLGARRVARRAVPEGVSARDDVSAFSCGGSGGPAECALGLSGVERGPAHKQDASLGLLAKPRDAGFLEPFVLLTHADSDIVKDYPDYGPIHRDKLNGFIDQYLVPPAP